MLYKLVSQTSVMFSTFIHHDLTFCLTTQKAHHILHRHWSRDVGVWSCHTNTIPRDIELRLRRVSHRRNVSGSLCWLFISTHILISLFRNGAQMHPPKNQSYSPLWTEMLCTYLNSHLVWKRCNIRSHDNNSSHLSESTWMLSSCWLHGHFVH